MVEESKERVCCCFAGWQPEPPLPTAAAPELAALGVVGVAPSGVLGASTKFIYRHARRPARELCRRAGCRARAPYSARTDLSPSHRQLVFHPPRLLAALPCDEHGTRRTISPARLSAMTCASVQRHVQMGRLYAPSTESSSSPQTLSPICCVLLPPCRSPSPRTPSKSSSESS